MGAKIIRYLSPIKTDSTTSHVTYRIDPEIASFYISSDDPDIANRQTEFWNNVGPEYADLARNIAYKVALLRRTSGDAAANAYREAATSILESLIQQDELKRKLES